MRIPYRMRAAINTYYALKFKNGGMFATTIEKEEAINNIDREARRYKMSYEIVPGVIYLSRKGKSTRISGPVKL